MDEGRREEKGFTLIEILEMLMRIWGVLNGRENKLVKDLERTTLSFEELGKRYGVSRQAVHGFCKRQGIKRKPKGHQVEECRLCRRLIEISKRRHSEFISIPTIVKETRTLRAECLSHLRALRDKGFVDERFGRLRSRRTEKAYAIYFTKRLPIRAIGRKAGLENFPSIIRKHRQSGWNVPPRRYVYGGRRRSMIESEIQRGKVVGTDRWTPPHETVKSKNSLR